MADLTRAAWYIPKDGRTATLRTGDGPTLAQIRKTPDGTWELRDAAGGLLASGCQSRGEAQLRAHELRIGEEARRG